MLRLGGTLGLVWNLDDDTGPWVARMHRLMGSEATIAGFDGPGALPGFCVGHRREVRWLHHLHRRDFEDLVRTWSRVSSRPESEREKIVSRSAELGVSAGDGDGAVALPLVTVAFRYHLGTCPR